MTMATTAAAATKDKTRSFVKNLYRSLLRASVPFADSAALNCLLYRIWRPPLTNEQSATLRALVSLSDSEFRNHFLDKLCQPPLMTNEERIYFRHCLNRVFWGTPRPKTVLDWTIEWESAPKNRNREYRFPIHLQKLPQLRDVIRDEFKCSEFPVPITDAERQRVAFLALRRMNEKLDWYYDLKQLQNKDKTQDPVPFPPLQFVPLNVEDPSDYLQPGTFLIAHPLVPSVFPFYYRSVILILDHVTTSVTGKDGPERETSTRAPAYATYGLAINFWATKLENDEKITLGKAFKNLPSAFRRTFGDYPIRQGGPVSGTLQMIHALPPTPDFLTLFDKLGGIQLPQISITADDDEMKDPEPAVFYKSNAKAAVDAVDEGELSLDQVVFFEGATTWGPGKLQSEVEQGYWLPCRAPPHYVLISPDLSNGELLWRTMLAACGPQEAELADLLWDDIRKFDDGKHDVFGEHVFSGPCDEGN